MMTTYVASTVKTWKKQYLFRDYKRLMSQNGNYQHSRDIVLPFNTAMRALMAGHVLALTDSTNNVPSNELLYSFVYPITVHFVVLVSRALPLGSHKSVSSEVFNRCESLSVVADDF